MSRSLQVLALQPYFGGSHAQFHRGWVGKSRHRWTTLSLPAHHWKWRMHHAALHFAEEIRSRVNRGESWDVVFCTDMMNVAEFRGFIQGDLSQIPVLLYFHENQFAYPLRERTERDQHFPFTNFVSAIAADQVWFNSQFNRDSMIEGLQQHSKRWPDHIPRASIESLCEKSSVKFPGIDKPAVDTEDFLKRRHQRAANGEPLRLIWAARWEHDKNASLLLDSIRLLESEQFNFEISVIGQSFRKVPAEFERIKSEFSHCIRRWGYQETRQQYWEALAESDVFVSTADHEFFGLSAAEAITSGLCPVLPNRLAYPELLRLAIADQRLEDHLYDGTPEGFVDCLKSVNHQRTVTGEMVAPDAKQHMLRAIGWDEHAHRLDDAIELLV